MDIDRKVNSFTEDMNACRDTIIPRKIVCWFHNKKSWITGDKGNPQPEKGSF